MHYRKLKGGRKGAQAGILLKPLRLIAQNPAARRGFMHLFSHNVDIGGKGAQAGILLKPLRLIAQNPAARRGFMHYRKLKGGRKGAQAGILLKPLRLIAQNPHRKVRVLCTIESAKVTGRMWVTGKHAEACQVFISCVPHKKRTKESGWGEALTARSFAAAVMDQPFFPNLEPPSPQTPTRPPSKERWES